jgi:hypothetical protein
MSLFEVGMLACFGAAWPMNILKSLRSRTAAGKSVLFQWAILVGYICGITNKILYNRDIVLALYILNFLMVATDTILIYRNRRLDKLRAQEAPKA